MAQLAVFAAVLACFGVAFAVPSSALRARLIAERDASVLGASVLVLGLGGMNLAFAAASAVNGGILPLDGSTMSDVRRVPTVVVPRSSQKLL